MKKTNFLLLLLFSIYSFAYADTQDNAMRARKLYSQVRCATCQGQSIEDSNSEHAKMTRDFIDDQINQNKSDEEILENIRIMYGEFLVFDPKFSYHTLMLWIVPFMVLSGLICVIVLRVRKTKIA